MAGHRCTLPLMSEGRSWIAGHAGLWWAGCCGPKASVERNENPAEREKSSRMRSLEQGRSSQHGHFLLAFVRSLVRSFVRSLLECRGRPLSSILSEVTKVVVFFLFFVSLRWNSAHQSAAT
ncbi:hypothetical protein OUZ56_030861 [Daphnia magna]|uniref:Uncharacterized protein n=1 Tax=Daphnia magna TaxID=35525 RepID=A0ABQ9ZTT4_9CRUS|nr:hypothetical protein OUZ56_030861 [Daphnia magna]